MNKKILITVIFFTIQVSSVFAQDIGKPYVDFSSVTSGGQPFKLSDISGKVIFLDFWASWCVPCKEEFPYLIKLYSQYKDSGFVVVAVNVDTDKGKLEKFIADLGVDVPFTIVADKTGKIPDLYKLEAMPTSFIIDRKGIIKYTHTGFESSDKETYVKEITELLSQN